MEPQRHERDREAADYRQSELPASFLRNARPVEEGNHEQRVSKNMHQPHPLAAQDYIQCVAFKAWHMGAHLTSSVSGSLVAKYEGWYIGSTLPGLTRTTPGLTTFKRYTYSFAPRGK